jgi:ammonium transporter, Amt family
MIVATALVLFMTLPGLSLFYGGLVRSKNVLSVLVQCLATAGVISLLWVAYGYSLAFTHGGSVAGLVAITPASREVEQMGLDLSEHQEQAYEIV